jgi:hypothetical protein
MAMVAVSFSAGEGLHHIHHPADDDGVGRQLDVQRVRFWLQTRLFVHLEHRDGSAPQMQSCECAHCRDRGQNYRSHPSTARRL